MAKTDNAYQLDQWIYHPPRWWHLKYRGGMFSYGRVSYEDLSERVRDALRFVYELEEGKQATWNFGTDRTGEIEIHVVRFKKLDDAIKFKLIYGDT